MTERPWFHPFELSCLVVERGRERGIEIKPYPREQIHLTTPRGHYIYLSESVAWLYLVGADLSDDAYADLVPGYAAVHRMQMVDPNNQPLAHFQRIEFRPDQSAITASMDRE